MSKKKKFSYCNLKSPAFAFEYCISWYLTFHFSVIYINADLIIVTCANNDFIIIMQVCY